jgi:methyl-accepting chemotaxis protein
MATLYDLELQESNNFIHALMQEGSTPALKLLNDQKQMAAGMGDVGKEMLAQFDDPNSDIGKGFNRLVQLQKDIVQVMSDTGLTTEVARAAQDIFNTSPESLSTLSDDQRNTINTYWTKKKTCIVLLLKRGYTHEELFS